MAAQLLATVQDAVATAGNYVVDTNMVSASAAEGETTTTTTSPKGDRARLRTLYVVVLRAEAKGPFKTMDEVDAHRNELLESLTRAGLAFEMYYSTQRDEIYVKVKASDHRLLVEADGDEPFFLELDPATLEHAALADDPPIHLRAPFDHSRERYQRRAALAMLRWGTATESTSWKGSTRDLAAASDGHGGWVAMTDAELEHMIHSRTKLDPFQHIYAPYAAAYEEAG